jgi:hypothetical protein
MTSTSAPAGAVQRIPEWLRLQAALSATALVVVVLRSAQLVRLSNETGTAVPWSVIAATQAAFWIGWSLWAGALVPIMRRLIERPAGSAVRAGWLLLLVVGPVFLVPLLYGSVHWLAYGSHERLSFGYIHSANHDGVTNLLLSVAIAGICYGYLGLQRARRLEVTAERLNAQLSRAELDALRAQLNPHFLFNALNSVAVLARRGRTAEVEQMVNQLAGLLRHSLESSGAQLVTLRVELEALEYYLAIEQVRHGERLLVEIDIPPALFDRLVPSLLLQPLAENSIRHGFVDGTHSLHLAIRGRASNGRLELTVTDDGAGLGQRESSGEGVGLSNTRARLAGLYGERASLTLSRGESGTGVRVVVILPDQAA